MNKTIRVAIVGYGNLGRGVELALSKQPDMTLVGVFSRREPATVLTAGAPVYELQGISAWQNQIDVLILCGGSRSDLPLQSPELAAHFNLVDSFDTHAKIAEHFDAVDKAAKPAGKTAVISAGWDPGLFSLVRVIAEAVLPDGDTQTFWGRGISQGHSDALRRVEGVADGVQYTIPAEEAMLRVRSGERPELTTRQKHQRLCYVVLQDQADPDEVRREIVTMPDYFEPYDTTVSFITQQELESEHRGMPHGGFVIRSGQSSADTNQTVEFGLKLDSNPEFTASVLVAYARAAFRLNDQHQFGAKTILDIPPAILSSRSAADLRATEI